MKENFGLIILGIMGIIFGIICLFGETHKWKYYIDRPENDWLFWHQRMQKKLMGKDAFVSFNLWSGIIATIGGIAMLIIGLKNIFF